MAKSHNPPSIKLGGPLKLAARNLTRSAGRYALSAVGNAVGKATTRLTDYVEGGGDAKELLGIVTGSSGRTGKIKGFAKMAWGGLKRKLGFGGGEGGKFKFQNIEETLDMGAPRRLVYNQWTQFADWPSYMKKVERVVQDEDQKLTFQVKIFWSRRTWQSTIQEQVPDEKIIWTSQGAKGYVDGSVTFHELTPDMTRVLVALMYYPKGFMEIVGGIWRPQGRRARLEFKHFRRHLMNHVLRDPEQVEGWRGVIHEGEVVKDHETALREEQEAQEAEERAAREEERAGEPGEREGERPGPEERGEGEEPEGEEPEGEEPEGEEPEGEEPEGEEPEGEEPEAGPGRRAERGGGPARREERGEAPPRREQRQGGRPGREERPERETGPRRREDREGARERGGRLGRFGRRSVPEEAAEYGGVERPGSPEADEQYEGYEEPREYEERRPGRRGSGRGPGGAREQ
ncbi:SRPBCC family protein [Sphaerisporangium sp. B11E5]|uniref:SRPBCC family protein n=1 Tax=Sphaerisporangium sp. B11E5 TaxID=3153563 RepID=UPI00325DE818